MLGTESVALELDDIQSGVLRPRPSPYAATYIGLRIDDRKAGRELMRRACGVVNSAAESASKMGDAWTSISITYQGLKALGVPQASLDSMDTVFAQGMAARAPTMKDIGPSAPEHWEKPFATLDLHVIITALAPTQAELDPLLERAKKAFEEMRGLTQVWRQDCYALETDKEHFGFKDGIGQPAIEGSGLPSPNSLEAPLKAGEFVLGYPDEMGNIKVSVPPVLGKNGTYVGVRKLHQNVAAFRQYLKSHSANADEEALLGAKMMGRWPSGAPLAVCPFKDDPAVAADPVRRNTFLYKDDDPRGLKTPLGSHLRRANPRDSDIIGVQRLHRVFRRGTVYGPALPEGVLEDDGVERGFLFGFICADPGRQFEFLQSQWVNDGTFANLGEARDPVVGAQESGDGTMVIPQAPIRRKLVGLPSFVVTRGGEYAFMPSLSALRWLADLTT
jgi:Dyp-type peroxidase family